MTILIVLIVNIVNTLNKRTYKHIQLHMHIGADDLYQQQFNQLLQNGDVQGAARLAAESPRGLLRTPNTIQMFQQVCTRDIYVYIHMCACICVCMGTKLYTGY